MITEFTTPFVEAKDEFIGKLKASAEGEDWWYASYEQLLRLAIETINSKVDFGDSEGMDPDRIHRIDDGSYQGTLVFVVGSTGYQPDDYWYTMVSYGSCEGCDTLMAACGYENPKWEEIYTLALHMMQRLKPMVIS